MALPTKEQLAEQAQVVGTPEWLLVRLLRQLEARQPSIRAASAYYDGDQPLAFASDKFLEAFGRRFPAFTSNFCNLVVEATAERLEVQGFRGFGSKATDDEVWRLWQESDLDASSQLAFVEAAIKGTAYGLVQPNGVAGPSITIEDATECIVEADPLDRRKRRAGLKRWLDDAGHVVVVLYLPTEVRKYRSANPVAASWPTMVAEHLADRPPRQLAPEAAGVNFGHYGQLWSAAGLLPWQPEGDADWPIANPMRVVPLVELPNRPRLRGPGIHGQSEVEPVTSNQDAINKYRADALIASEFAAFPQRYLLNYEPEVDENTGRSIEPFRAAIDRLWTVPPPDPDMANAPEPKIGQLAAADLAPYQLMIAMEVGHMASIARMPYHYLLGTPQTIPPSGESLKASEAGLQHKTGRIKLFMGEGLEELLRVGLIAGGAKASELSRSGETVWTDSETRNEAVRTDAIVKLRQQGIIDDELAWELAGLTPAQIRGLEERRAAQEADEAAEEEVADEAAELAAELAQAGGPPLPNVVPAPAGPRQST